MSRAILLFLLAIFFARAVWRLLEGILSGIAAPDRPDRRARSRTAPPSVQLVQDPVCGTFVVPGKSPSLVRAGETIYFCSDKCREQFAAR